MKYKKKLTIDVHVKKIKNIEKSPEITRRMNYTNNHPFYKSKNIKHTIVIENIDNKYKHK